MLSRLIATDNDTAIAIMRIVSFYPERKIKPRRTDNPTRLTLV